MSKDTLIACHDCDLIHRVRPIPDGAVAKCIRCGAVLYRQKPDSLERTLALTFAGLILYVVANTFPFLAFDMQGQVTQTTLITGVVDLWQQGMPGLAILVLLTSIVAPGLQLFGLLYVLVPLRLGRVPGHLPQVFRFVHDLQPWGMMEVFLLGILVSVVKLAGMATIVPGLAIWSFGVLIVVLAAAAASLDPREVWKRVEYQQ